MSKRITIGIPEEFNKSIHLKEESRFRGFFELLDQMHINYIFFSEPLLGINDLFEIDALLFSSPRGGSCGPRRNTKMFSKPELKTIHDFLHNGGKVLVLMRYSGDEDSKTNFKEIIPEIIPNDVILLHNNSFDKIINDPLINIYLQYDQISFYGKICYHSGCTFSTSIPVDLSLDFEENSHVVIEPRNIGHNTKKSKEREPFGKIFILKQINSGRIIYFGSRWSFSDDYLSNYDNRRFLHTIIQLLFPKYNQIELIRRMESAQRHRLLHGFPMSSGLKKEKKELIEHFLGRNTNTKKSIALGIIPHPFCIPEVRGCGFCTFPHEKYSRSLKNNCVNSVVQEIKSLNSKINNRPIHSLYLGGGTANLIDPSNFGKLCKILNSSLNIIPTAEITFEGVPAYFTPELLKIFSHHFPTLRKRISLGIQTFDSQLIKMMGRELLNKNIEKSLKLARENGIITSADFLFNLPSQSIEMMFKDVDRAIELQIPHICFYHLVCFSGLESKWSKIPDILKKLPNNDESLENWLQLYDYLIKKGFTQITLTDFKKDDSPSGDYYYEQHLRHPENYDWIGCGPGGISLISNFAQKNGIKIMNPVSSSDYIYAQKREFPYKKAFVYKKEDLQILWLTRQVKGLSIASYRYSQLFNSNLEKDFGFWLDPCINAGLIQSNDTDYQITPKGMFYSDSITGLLAHHLVIDMKKTTNLQSPKLRYQNEASHEKMG